MNNQLTLPLLWTINCGSSSAGVGDPGSLAFYAVLLTGLILCRPGQEDVVAVSSKVQMSCSEDIILQQSSPAPLVLTIY